MLRALIERKLSAEERKLGASLDYARHILRTSLRAFLRFTKAIGLSSYRRRLPVEPWAVARIVATRDADCGTCVQIEVNLAKRAGVPAGVLAAAVQGRPDDLEPELRSAYRFAAAVARATGEEDALRDEIRRRWGEEGLVEMAIGIAACRFFPVVKRALGYATSCRLVRIEV
ncbi:MAG: hypothetical protein ACREID_00345 [Planctomycetota bacterium]